MSSYLNPRPLPIHILKIASAMPPMQGVYALSTFPSLIKAFTFEYIDLSDSPFGSALYPQHGESSTTLWPGPLNSGLIILSVFSVVTANETRVGGTSRSSKLPLIESLPPIAAIPRFF